MRRAATEKVSSSPNGVSRSPPTCIPYRYATAQGGFVDLRLMDRDLMRKALPILVTVLEREARGWFLHFRERLIAELRSKKMQDEEIEQVSTCSELQLLKIFILIFKSFIFRKLMKRL